MKNYRREQGASLGIYAKTMTGIVLAAVMMISGSPLQAATLEATPNISIKYNYNNNLYAQDPNELPRGEDLVTASYMDYLVGLTLAYKAGRHGFGIEGDAGYEQFLTITGWVKDSTDKSPQDYNYVNLHLRFFYTYTAPKLTMKITDTLSQTRDLQDLFGPGTDALGYWSLYLNNLASVNASVQFTPRLRTLFMYSYDSLIFATPENDVPPPPDSYEHRGYFRSEYTFTQKTKGIVDVQAAIRHFSTVDNIGSADYLLWQAMAGIGYNFSPRTNLTVLGGWSQRTFSDLSDQRLIGAVWGPYTGDRAYDLQNMSNPVARVTLTFTSPTNSYLAFSAVQGISTYGQNLFFTYTLGSADLGYYFTPNLRASLSAQYRQAVYSRDQNGRDWEWNNDRVDNNIFVTGLVHWDILKKRNHGTLILEVGGSYQNRDSNIDSSGDYTTQYVNSLGGLPVNSNDAVVATGFVRVQIVPTLLFGR